MEIIDAIGDDNRETH